LGVGLVSQPGDLSKQGPHIPLLLQSFQCVAVRFHLRFALRNALIGKAKIDRFPNCSLVD